MSFRTDALHMAYSVDRTGRVREACGNCSDWLEDQYFVVQAHLADGSRVEVHICRPCVDMLQQMAEQDNIPLVELEAEPAEGQREVDPR